MKLRLQIASVTLAAAVWLFGSAGTAGAAPQHDDMKARHGEMKRRHEKMMARHEDMMARTASLDARIQMLMQEMNSFMGDAKIDAMAELLTAVVEQNQAMRSGMAEMKGGMAAMMESSPMPRSHHLTITARHKSEVRQVMADKIRIEQHSGSGLLWGAGWLFTVGFLQLTFWKGVLALLLWPYYLSVLFTGWRP